MPVMGENEIGRDFLLQLLEARFYLGADIWEEAIAEAVYADGLLLCMLQKQIGALQRFLGALAIGAEDDPCEDQVVVLSGQTQDRSPTSNLYVVAVRAETEYVVGRAIVC